MKFIIFSLLVSFCLCSEVHVFRYNNGTFTKGNKSPITISGTLYYEGNSKYIFLLFFGMDYSTMTPLFLFLEAKGITTTGIEIKLNCYGAQYELKNEEYLFGTGVLTGSWDKSEFKGECYTKTGDLRMFKSSNVKSQTFFYPQKEAGFRAKFLIDQPTSKYKPANIINFAIVDYPYATETCNHFLHFESDAPGPEPGAIMVGKDGNHCAILDNEGTKFIQSNSEARKVTYDSIAVAERYFPKGIIYKTYSTYYDLKFSFTKLPNESLI